MSLKELFINTERPFTKYSIEEILKIIKNKFKDNNLKFLGWIHTVHIISIDNVNYKVSAGLNGIKLTETNSMNIKISSYSLKQECFKKYNEILNN